MMKSHFLKIALPAVLGCATSLSTFAAVTIEGTRIIYPENAKEKTVKFFNEGNKAALMQLWIDNGEIEARPQDTDTPFIIMPPVFKLDGQKGQNARISLINAQLPKDRESIFWFNALEIPQKANNLEDDQNYMQIATRSRLKLFYRPNGLAGNPTTAAENVQWTLKKDASKLTLTGVNNSPYYTTITSIKVTVDSKEYAFEGVMIDPYSKQSVSLQNKSLNSLQNAKMTYQIVGDFGLSETKSSQLNFN